MAGGIPDSGTLRIGEALKRARTGQGMDVRTAEERTKIRIKYLRAMENEQWDLLPGPTYAKGFLRTYAAALGLDAERMVDEFRRQVESNSDGPPSYSFGEPVLERRRRPGERTERRPAGFVWLGVGAVAALIVAILVGSGDDDAGERNRAARDRGGNQREPGASASPTPGGPVTLSLLARQDIRACLVRAPGAAVIDAQALDAGSESGPFQPADRYRLDLETGGAVELTLDGRRQVIRAPRKSSFVITSAGVRAIDFRGPRCP